MTGSQSLSAAAGLVYRRRGRQRAALVDTAPPARRSWARGRIAPPGSTETPRPPFDYMQQVYDRYIAPHYLGYAFSGLYTPARFQPWTGIPSLTYDQSVAEGAGCLHTATSRPVRRCGVGFRRAPVTLVAPSGKPAGRRRAESDQLVRIAGQPQQPKRGILARFPVCTAVTGLTSHETDHTTYPLTTLAQYDGFAAPPTSWRTSTRCWVFTIRTACITGHARSRSLRIVLPVSSPDNQHHLYSASQRGPAVAAAAARYCARAAAGSHRQTCARSSNWVMTEPDTPIT